MSKNGSKSRSSGPIGSESAGTTTRVVLVRHGETDWNVIHRLQGVTDTNLTEAGRKQAERAAHRLAKADRYAINHVYASNLARAVHTAEEIVKATKLPGVNIDKRFREFDIGIFAGHTQVEARGKYPAEWREHIQNPEYIIPKGESYAQFIERTTAAMEDLRRQYCGQTICVVTHGGVIDCLRNYLVSEHDGLGRQARCGNGSISELVADANGVWRIAKWNDCSHMASLHKPILVADDVTTTHRARGRGQSAASSTASDT